MLLKSGADIGIRNKVGDSVLRAGIRSQQTPVVQLLLKTASKVVKLDALEFASEKYESAAQLIKDAL
jgi:ankyrin repeat protein